MRPAGAPRRWPGAALPLVLLAAGCGGAGLPARPAVPAGTAAPAPSPAAGWQVTVYYTAVAALHDDADVPVTGCPRLACSGGDADLGAYPASFVAAVRTEGTGRIARGRYLNWSYDVGYWLDSAPRDAAGGVLRPWASAAADPDVLARGTAFRIADCGTADDGAAVPAGVCAALRAARWTVTDEFTPGLGGERHVDVYVGEETGLDFTATPAYTTLTGAVLAVG